MHITDPPTERPKHDFGSCSSAPHPNPRREWLTATFRWLALAGLAAVATVLGLRRSSDAGQSDCLRELPCGQCGLNRQCKIPQAAAWRDVQERNT